jgi:probable rRNA maturation factor
MKLFYNNIPKNLHKTIEKVVKDFFLKNYLNLQATINITFVDSDKIQSLNKTYRKIDKPTDVLSFPIFKHFKDIPKNSPYILGDIIICPDKTNLDKELPSLIFHSLNHLIGKHHRL